MENEELEMETLETLEDKTSENEQSEELNALKEEVEKLRKDNQTLSAQKEHFREKSEKIISKKEEPTPTTNHSPLELVNLAKALNDYSSDEVDFLIKVAKSDKPADIIAATQDEWVKTAINSRREKIEKEKKIPSPSSPLIARNPIESVALANNKEVTDEEIDKKTKQAFEQSRKNKGVTSI